MTILASGRTIRVELPVNSDYNRLLTAAVDAQFDWVFYAASNYVRLSVIPSSEFAHTIIHPFPLEYIHCAHTAISLCLCVGSPLN